MRCGTDAEDHALTSSIAHPVVDRQATGRSNHKSGHLDWSSADKHALLWARRGRWVPAPTPTEIGGASGGASTAIGAGVNLENRHEAPHFEEQPCSCPEGSVATKCVDLLLNSDARSWRRGSGVPG